MPIYLNNKIKEEILNNIRIFVIKKYDADSFGKEYMDALEEFKKHLSELILKEHPQAEMDILKKYDQSIKFKFKFEIDKYNNCFYVREYFGYLPKGHVASAVIIETDLDVPKDRMKFIMKLINSNTSIKDEAVKLYELNKIRGCEINNAINAFKNCLTSKSIDVMIKKHPYMKQFVPLSAFREQIVNPKDQDIIINQFIKDDTEEKTKAAV